jgi:glyoxylase-like metal-dependent hydrolase (beta-lactamase superfamily II)
MFRTLVVRVFLLLTLAGCASTGHVDPPFSAQDEAELAQLRERAARVAATRPRAAFEAAREVAPMAGTLEAAATGPLLEVHVFNIGQADSMLVIGPRPARKTLLVDLGEHNPANGGTHPRAISNAEHVRQRIRDLTGGTHVDYFVLSHYHGDHANGIYKLLSDFDKEFSVGEFIHVGNANARFLPQGQSARSVHRKITESMQSWMDAGRVMTSSAPRFGTEQIDLGDGVEVDILAFGGHVRGETESAFDRVVAANRDYAQHPASENDLSIALEISAGEFELFTAGDLSGTDDPAGAPLFVHRRYGGGKTETYTNVEGHMLREWARSGRRSDVEVYRANHHGSPYSSTQALVDALDPEFVVYSTGAQHGHPSGTVVHRLRSREQFATTAVTDRTAFRNAGGRIGREITIAVERDGVTYTIEGEQQTARARN